MAIISEKGFYSMEKAIYKNNLKRLFLVKHSKSFIIFKSMMDVSLKETRHVLISYTQTSNYL